MTLLKLTGIWRANSWGFFFFPAICRETAYECDYNGVRGCLSICMPRYYGISELYIMAGTPKLRLYSEWRFVVLLIYFAGVRWSRVVGASIQGLVLFWNQQLLFGELGGFVNNAFLCPWVCACWQASPHNFYFFCLFFLMGCLWIGVIRRIFLCQHPCSFIPHVQSMDVLAANYVALVRGKRRADGVHCQPFTPPPFMWRCGDGEGGNRGLRG